MSKWKKLSRKPRPKYDVLDQLGINPLDHYKVSCWTHAICVVEGNADVAIAEL
jgi:hypothetical protein